ncbi:hypothetical protein [Bradyrhizobium sp. LHD-71]|uniref:hypothetical protein n=1 Tax=Bradyrhizobium sp. LHD-71 TaxID=3072141 RepID=UPI00280FFF7D|nr:hypothetical protein [Bradyrhizobium sp. LHD-71]MDQ8730086.1 hypothetical protein [Bradyrhizobium sp. LHD-71]
MNQIADDLVQECMQAARDGAEFGAIWDSILRGHSLVAGPPIQTFEEGLHHLDIRLRNGYWLRYCARSHDFSLRRAMLHRAF